MIIKQFEYKPLAHYSYAIISNREMAVIDPERNPLQYYQLAKEHDVKIIAVIQTHPHADFVSSHLQIHEETGATIYNSRLLGADYPHQGFDEGDSIKLGEAILSALNTPGHSPDSITIVAEGDNKTALFTGDTLFIGDVGRPDLREKAGKMTAKRRELAEMMYETITEKFKDLPDGALVYPAHGAGSLCGKNLSEENSSTLGNERMANWAFKEQTKEEFVQTLLNSQPFIPSYFGFNVDINKNGAENLRASTAKVPFHYLSKTDGLIVDTRSEVNFKKGHLPNSVNIQLDSINSKFETWLGSIIQPKEDFHIIVENPNDLETVLDRVSKIGYESQLNSIFTINSDDLEKSPKLNLEDFKNNPENYRIIDIRNASELEEGKFFESALSHPLNQLRDSAENIPTDKPIVVHCAGGYRSAAGSSILEYLKPQTTVYDLSEEIENFK